MSYDFSIGEESFNYTYNTAKMFYSAIPEGVRTLDGLTGQESLTPLLAIYIYMVENKAECLHYEPSNGWGSYEGSLDLIHNLTKAALNNLDEIWEVS